MYPVRVGAAPSVGTRVVQEDGRLLIIDSTGEVVADHWLVIRVRWCSMTPTSLGLSR